MNIEKFVKLYHDFACSPSVLDLLETELRRQGFAGSTNVPKLVYLAGTTRLFQEPVSLVGMGPSGSGKSYAFDSGLQFIPPSAVENVSGMSEKLLAYAHEMDLKHRILFLGEAAGMAEGNGRTFLRQLLSENRVQHMTVQKTATGMKAEKLPPVEGPLVFMMTTTATKIHHEDQSRMLVVNINEDSERIRQGLLNKAAGLSKSRVPLDTGPWFALQEVLQQGGLKVTIPFANDIAKRLPVDNFKIQRDFPKLLALLEACALVHQCTRPRDREGRIVASYLDYREVYPLVKEPLEHGLGMSVPDGVREVVRGVHDLTSIPMPDNYHGVSQSKVAAHIGRERSVVSRNCYAAISQGYLQNLAPGKGREAQLVLGDRELPSGSVLPSPEELFGAKEKETGWPSAAE